MRPAARQPAAGRDGAVLLEVIFAITLLAAAGAVVYSSLSFSARSVRQLRLGAQAADLANSVLAELQMGTLELINDGPVEADGPHWDWTWQTIVDEQPGRDETEPDMLRVEVVVYNDFEDYSFRLVQWMVPPAETQEAVEP
ncbi:MAG: hypothetical protein ACLFUJ_11475 [Phycisphaerae bacterium]